MDSFLGDFMRELLLAFFVGFLVWTARLFGWRVLLWPRQVLRGWTDEDVGRDIADCPYPPGSIEARAWKAGWEASKEGTKR